MPLQEQLRVSKPHLTPVSAGMKLHKIAGENCTRGPPLPPGAAGA